MSQFNQANSLILPKREDGTLCFKEEHAPNLPKVAVISIPKAGTYFMGSILKELGLIDLELHVGATEFDDYRGLSINEKRDNPQKYRINNYKIEHLTPFVLNGQFFVGHIPATEYVYTHLREFKKVFIYRNLKDCAVSDMRFTIKTGRPAQGKEIWGEMEDGPEKMAEYLKTRGRWMMAALHAKIVSWIRLPDVIAVSYEDLQGDGGEEQRQKKVDEILSYLTISGDVTAKELLEKINSKETLTKSGKRSSHEDYWSDEVEKIFNDIGGNVCNEVLGY